MKRFAWTGFGRLRWVEQRILRYVGNFLVSLAGIVLMIGCNSSTDQQLQRKLPGTWTLQPTNPSGSEFKSVVHLSSAGFYTAQITRTEVSNAAYHDQLEGTWRIENGVLVDTTTKHSNTNFSPHERMVWRAKVVRLTKDDFIVEQDGINDWNSPFKQIAFRRSDN